MRPVPVGSVGQPGVQWGARARASSGARRSAEPPTGGGARMNAFIVSGQDRPGELARVAEAVAERGVNITNITCVAWGGQGAIALLTNDEPATRSLLSAKGFPYREVELVACTLEDN